MKKILLLISIFLFLGCDNLMNTPIKKTEKYFEKYQTLDDDVLNSLSYSIESVDLTNEEKDTYRNLIKRQYSDLLYEIKDDEIDGNIAKVKVEIEVYDYSLAIKKAIEYLNQNKEEFLDEYNQVIKTKYIDYKFNLMKDIKDRIKYTLEVSLSKKNKIWIVDQLSEENLQKIHGIFIN